MTEAELLTEMNTHLQHIRWGLALFMFETVILALMIRDTITRNKE
jgi:hypothetical protein